jgi:hypothetical protein
MRCFFTTAALLAASTAIAQTPEPQAGVRVFKHKIGGPGGLVAGIPADNIHFVAAEFSFGDKTVTGAPYSAEAITETTQTLADGNKISRKNSAQLYRDSEGRTRRDQTIDHIGPWSTQSGFKSSIIHDPVSGQHYILDPQSKTARKLPEMKPDNMIRSRVAGAGGAAAGVAASGPSIPAPPMLVEENVRIEGPHVQIHRLGPAGVGEPGEPAVKTESLGSKIIEGLVAEGTRTTLTIPAGQIGNERPIEVVTERWYSPELQLVVMTRNSDPRMGESMYKLTKVQRSEPARDLFEVPPDYTIKESTIPHKIEILRPSEPGLN